MSKVNRIILLLYVTTILLMGTSFGQTYSTYTTNDTNSSIGNMAPAVVETTIPVQTTIDQTPAAPIETPVETVPIATPKSPGFEIVITIGIISAIYILKRR